MLLQIYAREQTNAQTKQFVPQTHFVRKQTAVMNVIVKTGISTQIEVISNN